MVTGTGPPRPGDERGTAGDGATGLVSDGGFGARHGGGVAGAADPLLALASSHPCVDELDAVVTEVRFVDDDTASVRFDVTGEPLRQVSFQVDRAYGFETSVHRTPAGWKVDPSLAGRMADTGKLLRSVPGC